MLEEYRSPRMPSNVQAAGKYAKKEGCCQWVNPINGYDVKQIGNYKMNLMLNLPGMIYFW